MSEALEQNETEGEKLEREFPSVELAYPLAVAAYDLAQKRLDVVEGRLQTLLAFVAPATVAVTVAAVSKNVSYRSPLFIAAMVCCLAGFALGVYTRLSERLLVIDPAVLSQKWLHFSEWQFKRNVVHLSGKHFEKNATVMRIRAFIRPSRLSFFFLRHCVLRRG